MMETLMKRTQAMNMRVVMLSAFASSNRSRKVGFIQTGRILKKFFKGDKYIDRIIMTKMLESEAHVKF